MAQGIDLARLGGEPLARFAVTDERIVDLVEGILSGSLVGHEELLLLRLGLLDRALDGARGKDGTDENTSKEFSDRIPEPKERRLQLA